MYSKVLCPLLALPASALPESLSSRTGAIMAARQHFRGRLPEKAKTARTAVNDLEDMGMAPGAEFEALEGSEDPLKLGALSSKRGNGRPL